MESFMFLKEGFLVRMVLNFLFIFTLVRLIYYRIYKKRDLFFSFYMLNFIVFVLSFLLNSTSILIGAAFGLFATFTLLRYRTEAISSKDMTYLFLTIAMGLVNSIINAQYIEIGVLNVIVLSAVFAADGSIFSKNEKVKTIEYDQLENIKPQDQHKLIEDLKNRTGLPIHKVSIKSIDFKRNNVTIKAYYY